MNTELLRTKARRKATAFVLLWMLLVGLAMGRAQAAGLTFAVGSTNAVTNSQVVVPIRVTNFTSISSFQFSFHWNTNVARFMGVEQFALPGQTTNDFGLLTSDYGIFPEGTLAALWFEPNGGSTNVPDGTQIFGIRFQFVGAAAATCPVRIDGVPTAIFAADGNLDPVPVSIVDSILSIDRTLIVTPPAGKIVECGTPWVFDPPVTIDSCGGLGSTNIVLDTVTNYTGTCGFSATRSWEVIDHCTNRAVFAQTVTAIDTTPPTPLCAPDKTIEFGQAWSFDAPSGFDACVGTNVNVVAVSTVTNAGPCGRMFTAARTWQISDGCSNAVSCVQVVMVRDTTAPVIFCAPDKSINCLGVWSFDGPGATDIADGAAVTIEVVGTVTNGSCGASFVATRTWRATDSCGNFSECSQSAYGRAIVTLSGAVFVPTNFPATMNEKRVATAKLIGPTNVTTTSVADGSFDLTFDAASEVAVEAYAPTSGQPADGVSTLDITFLRRHILNLALLDTPYKRLAGDVDGSGSITTLDLSFVRRLVLGSTNRFPRGLWRFVPSDFVFTNPAAPWSAPTNRTYSSVWADAPGQDFLAVKLGDVNSSWTPPASAAPSVAKKAPASLGGTNGVTFIAPVTNGYPGDEIVVPIVASGFTYVNGFQFTLRWDTQTVAFVNLGTLGLPGMAVGNFNTNFARGYTNLPGNPGVITVQWDDSSGGAIDLPEGATVFEARFRLLDAPSNTTALTIDGSVTAFEVVNGDLVVATSSAIDGSVYVKQPNRAPVIAPVGGLSIPEGALFSFTPVVSDADGSVQTLTYALEPGAPAGASIDPVTGVFTWTPSEAQGPGLYNVTIRVVDNGLPAALSDTESFSITVNEANNAPLLTAIGSKTVNEGALLSFTALASDLDQPAQTLTFSLSNAPVGASITSGGAFTFTPSEGQGPGSYNVTVLVTDNGSPALSAAETIAISVNESNIAPVLTPIGGKIVNEGALLSFNASATDADLPAQALTFSLSNAPAGASITSGGVFTWTPTEAQGPSSYNVTVLVTDSGLSAFETITITVNESNTAPLLTAIGNKTVNESALLNFNALATDADLPAQVLTFSLSNAPAGASITSGGVFTWTPSEAQGPGSFNVTVRVTDNGSPALSAFETITLSVNESNISPTLPVIGDKAVVKNNLLSFSAAGSDLDLPVQTLTYGLEPGAPTGTAINPTTGLFTWTPSNNQGPATNSITVRATDNGPGTLSSTRTFNVFVLNDNTPPVLGAIGNKEVTTQTLLTFTATATDVESTSQILTFTLEGAPAGASIDPLTGVFTWTPTDGQGPSTNIVTVRVTDNAFVPDSDSETIQIVVREFIAPTISIADTAAPAGSDGSFTAEFEVTLSAPSARTVSVNYATADGSGLAGEDYTPMTGTLVFEPGVTNLTLDIEVAGKSTVYTNRTFYIQLSQATNGIIADGEALGELVATPAPGLYIDDVSLVEGNAGRSNAVFTVLLRGPHTLPVTVNYTALKGTALTRKDFSPKRGKLKFPVGTNTVRISIPVVGELLSEYDETYTVVLSRSVNSVIIQGTGHGTILDDDALPVLSITDAATTEGSSGARALAFTLRLSAKSGRPVSVGFSTADGTAVGGSDYLVTNGTALIPAGKLFTKISVPILGNLRSESNETFFVNLANAVNATLGDAQGAGNVSDNDRAPSVAVNDAQVFTDVGGSFAVFTVVLSAPSDKPVTVNVATAGNTALAGVDYVGYPEAPVYFPPGVTAQNVVVSLLDNPASSGKRFYLTTIIAVNAALADKLGACIIP